MEKATSTQHGSFPRLLVFFFFLATTTVGAQGPVFDDEQEVRATDLWVEVDTSALRDWFTDEVTPTVAPKDLEIRFGEQTATAIGVAPIEDPWRFIFYFETRLLSAKGLRWSAETLIPQIDRLAKAGSVEIVLGEATAPRLLLPATRDTERINTVLADLALFPSAQHEILHHRSELLRELHPPLTKAAPELDAQQTEELLNLVQQEELDLIRRYQDDLLSWTADQTSGQPTAFFLFSEGFDLGPHEFYHSVAVDMESPAAVTDHRNDLQQSSVKLAQALASYGWIVFPYVPPEPEFLVPGLRIGKWLVRPMGPSTVKPKEDERAEQNTERSVLSRVGQVLLAGFQAKYQEHRDPEKAQAYVELAQALEGQGKLADAEDAYSKALYHYAKDPETASEQAEAAAGLGAVLAEQGKAQAAQDAFDQALILHPEMAEEVGPNIAFQNPDAALHPLASATSGQVLGAENALPKVIEDLQKRLRLTVQLDGLPKGSLLPLEVRRPAGKSPLKLSRWTRSSTPKEVAEARLRRALEGELKHHFSNTRVGEEVALASDLRPLPLAANLDPTTEGGYRIKLRLDIPPNPLQEAEAQPRRLLRISWGSTSIEESATERAIMQLEHQKPYLVQGKDISEWQKALHLDLPPNSRRVAALVEDLLSEQWELVVFDLD